jgi:hypothetical protein
VSDALRGRSQHDVAPPRGPFTLRICGGCGQQVNDGHHLHRAATGAVYELPAAPLAIIDAAIERLEAGFEAQWPSGRMPRKHSEGWMAFAEALDYLRDAHRTEDMTPSALRANGFRS